VTDGTRHRRPADDDVVFLDDSAGEDVARAVEDAVRAVTAVEARHRHGGTDAVFPHPPTKVGAGPLGDPEERGVPGPLQDAADDRAGSEGREARLLVELEASRERAGKAEEETRLLREALLRKTADLENVRRRTEKEKSDHFRFALAEAFRDLLGVADNFERALAHAPEGIRDGDFGVGVGMIGRQLTEVLKRYGLTEVPAERLPFDPNVHEAVAREETADVPSGIVLAVFQKGYFLNDRLLRPAMVKVSASPVRPKLEEPQ
jgi:molecular chaperone GrpE